MIKFVSCQFFVVAYLARSLIQVSVFACCLVWGKTNSNKVVSFSLVFFYISVSMSYKYHEQILSSHANIESYTTDLNEYFLTNTLLLPIMKIKITFNCIHWTEHALRLTIVITCCMNIIKSSEKGRNLQKVRCCLWSELGRSKRGILLYCLASE